MSKYTTQVRYICESFSGLEESEGYRGINDVILGAIPKIFDADIKLYDEQYKTVLFTKILRHYYTREICEESVGLWLLRFNNRLHEIMPYYNEMYKTTLLDVDVFNDVNITVDRKKTTDGESVSDKKVNNTSTVTEESNSQFDSTDNASSDSVTDYTRENTRDLSNTDKEKGTEYKLYSETPQGALTNVDNETYLTSATKNTTDIDKNGSENETQNIADKTTENATNERNVHNENAIDRSMDSTLDGTENVSVVIKNTDDYIEHIVGKRSPDSYSKRLLEFRKTIINIDMMIIEELSDLFFALW